MADLRRRFLRLAIVAYVLGCLDLGSPALGEGQLDAVRQDVRTADSSASPSEPPHHGDGPCGPVDEGLDFASATGLGYLAGAVVTSPFWVPHQMLGDDLSTSFSFARFPYADGTGYATRGDPSGARFWSAQFAADYATTFNDLDSIGGRFVLNTSSRFGFDGSGKHFEEHLSGGRHDALWLGDANLVYCFAQNGQMQWRTGLGVNWLDDARRADVGFNFTYGFDWFPRRPWVVSTEIDWGSLGRSSLFHFRSTVGVIYNRFEAYTGYEYYDFDRVQTNALIGGVRVWF